MRVHNLNKFKSGLMFLIALTLMIGLFPITGQATTDTLWIQNFEDNSWNNDWHVDYGSWQVGVPTSGPDSAYTGVQCAGTILDGNYYENVSSRLISPVFTVPVLSENPRLRFWNYYNFNAGDFGQVQIRVVGDTSWVALPDAHYGSGSPGYHSSNHWTRPLIDLSSYAGQTVEICFYFYSTVTGTWGDTHVSTGWYFDDLMVETGSRSFSDPEDWESGIDDWYADHGIWEVGVPTSGPDSAYTGVQCAGTILDGNYYENVSSRLISPVFTVPALSENPRLRFWNYYNFNAGDFGQVQIRVVGDTSWVTLPSGQYSGSSGGVWLYTYFPLFDYAGQTVELSFYTSELVNKNGTHFLIISS